MLWVQPYEKKKKKRHTAVEPNQGLFLPSIEVYIDPEVWAIGGITGRAKNTQLVEISLKDQNLFLCQKQYPL